MERAKLAFAGDSRFVFARRIVTRIAVAEDHESIEASAFEQAESMGSYLLSWRAHELGYALPGSLRDELAKGRIVVANVSRSVILKAEALGHPVTVLHVTADPVILAARIAARGRESMAQVRARMGRIAPLEWRRSELIEIRNESALESAAALFIDALQRCAEPEEARA